MGLSVHSDEHFMKEALKQAQIGYENGEIPVGAVVVCENRIIARAYNQTELLNDVTAHAEMIAITSAADYLGGKYLVDCKLYVTLEPCSMCAGALAWAQISEIIYGAHDPQRGFRRLSPSPLHPKTEVKSGILENECKSLIQDFFKDLRK
ncbi:nucleoside deaminase [Marinigracilibium pacificum]|uniref:tRNA-specific adenosine deaminase n=1 Tax=Marinigracilibium pacificum TaxID=2729599 RepID=A0A848J1L0_9BACT|nr:nucleoside deaminase [Marinigracilibium pacificum]NMM49581.1 nucleoside deaminase [Marinigracilibium pacificum]